MAAMLTVKELAARVPDGASVALPPDYSGCALAAVRALIRRGARDLHLIGVPQLGFQADLLIGAGCVRSVEAAAVTLGEQGPAPRFVAAVQAGAIDIRDSTCPAIHAGLQAAEKGVPFLPLRGILGSDLVRHRPDWRVIDNPFAGERAIRSCWCRRSGPTSPCSTRCAPIAPAMCGSACGVS
jgi:glutaconate CoA-transferase subunit A